ncbi:hypothetical protein ANRL1_00451 [Anaerolineae bacterium]|nr:hypothetical protein ANRL1_00451 [Anaerolineae bacterium]
MLLQVGEFCELVENDLNSLVDELSVLTNRQSPYEISAWRNSLQQLSTSLNHPLLSPFHIQLGGSLSLEYNLPASSAWCDAILLGRNQHRPSAVIIELKDWDLSGDQPANRETLILHHGSPYSHPSDQVRGYVEYCRYFHSEVIEGKADVSGCVFFTSAKDATIYKGHPYQAITAEYPVFTRVPYGSQDGLPAFLSECLKEPDQEFAGRFEKGTYVQDRSLIRQISKLIQGDQKTFVLLDNQRTGYELCLDRIDNLLKKTKSSHQKEKLVVIVEGPPGSGKSVLAAKIWAALSHDERMQGNNVVMTSTSSAQKTNWQILFQQVAGHQAGRGVILPSNKYNPGLTTNWMKAERAKGHPVTAQSWRQNLKLFAKIGITKMPDNQIWASVVDEAHALFDPSLEHVAGVQNAGWQVIAGPQAYHIIRASQVSIFLLDSNQSYRDNETTTPDKITEWARELGVPETNIEQINLGGIQFRSGGSKEYVAWVEHVLELNDEPHHLHWRSTPDNVDGVFDLEVADDPEELVDLLRAKHQAGMSARFISSYSRKWKTKDIPDAHNLPPSEKDFFLAYVRKGQKKHWASIWNFLGDDESYHWFIQAPPGSKIHQDPFCEVGCPYVVRGFDFDYLGVLWLSDLVWRKDHWDANFQNVHETAWRLTLSRARHENPRGPATAELIRQLKRGYRILLTRALKGIYLWIEDPETRDHIRSML